MHRCCVNMHHMARPLVTISKRWDGAKVHERQERAGSAGSNRRVHVEDLRARKEKERTGIKEGYNFTRHVLEASLEY